MPRYICKLKGKYFEWSSVVEAPITSPMALKEFKVYYLKEYGVINYKGLKHRLERVEKQGTSCQLGSTLDEFIELAILNGSVKSKKELWQNIT